MRAIVTGMAGQPSGTVTILFSDIEGSTRLLQQLGAEQYAEALELLEQAIAWALGEQPGPEPRSYAVSEAVH
jgi:class 3 adenylate cyclase